MAEILFYFFSLILFYTYIGYPLFLAVASFFLKTEVKRGIFFPSVTIVIPVYNEENLIEKKIINCLAYDYPKEKLDIIVASDGSIDGTHSIVEQFTSEGVRLVSLAERSGKVVAQNKAVEQISSDIVIFTDVAIITTEDAIRNIVQNFFDESVGVVSCRDKVISEENTEKGEGSYIKYDMLVRNYATKIGSLIGVTGGFYAVRKKLVVGGWNPAFPPDFHCALKAIRQGFRVVEDQRVIASYKAVSKSRDEFRRKVRTITRGMYAFFSNIRLLNVFEYGFSSINLLSHKLFRWMTPLFLLMIFWNNVLILGESFFIDFVFFGQMTVYILGFVGFFLSEKQCSIFIFKLPKFFILANAAIIKAWIEYLTGNRYVVWEPTKR